MGISQVKPAHASAPPPTGAVRDPLAIPAEVTANGVLTVKIPEMPSKQPRQIKVETE